MGKIVMDADVENELQQLYSEIELDEVQPEAEAEAETAEASNEELDLNEAENLFEDVCSNEDEPEETEESTDDSEEKVEEASEENTEDGAEKAPEEGTEEPSEKNEDSENKESAPKDNAVKKPKRRMSKGMRIICTSFVAVICSFVVLMLVAFAINPKKAQSETENRSLAQMPKLTLSTLSSGRFMSDFETYLSDQFPLRDVLVSFKTAIDRSTGLSKVNDVYIGKNGFLFENPTSYDKEKSDKLNKAINKFQKSNSKVKIAVAVAPNSSYILSENLPDGLSFESQKEQLKTVSKGLSSDISWIDITKRFEKISDKEALYYRTDHHWTTRGAYEAFKLLADEWGLKTEKVDYKFYTASTSFQGTLASNSGINKSTDTIELCAPEKAVYTVDFDDEKEKTATVFDIEKLDQKNQYEVFFGGNYGKVTIDTVNKKDKVLLVFKDSYANCLIPMLIPYFEKIVIIDPRYYNGNFSDVLEGNAITHALFMYNCNTFLDNSKLTDLLNG